MKVKILVHIPMSEFNTWSDFKVGEVMNLDDKIANQLIKQKKAEFIF